MSGILRPLTLGELLDRAFQIYRSRFVLFVSVAALAYLPLFVVQTATLWTTKGRVVATLSVFLIAVVMRLVGVAAASSATIIIVSAIYLDRPITLREAYGRVSGMLVRIFFIMMGLSIGIGIGLLLLVVPGVILGLMWALTIPVAVLEDTGLGDSLSRSRYLTEGHRFRVLAIFLLYFALVFALELGFLGPIGAVMAVKGKAAIAAAAQIITIATIVLAYLIQCLVTPILTISLSLMYYDERIRKEAFDIQIMMTALGGGAIESAAAGAS